MSQSIREALQRYDAAEAELAAAAARLRGPHPDVFAETHARQVRELAWAARDEAWDALLVAEAAPDLREAA